MPGVLHPRIQHQSIKWRLVLAQSFDHLGHGGQIRQICNTGLRSRQRRSGVAGPLFITAKHGQLISTGHQGLRCLQPDTAAGTGDQNSAPFSCRHGVGTRTDRCHDG